MEMAYNVGDRNIASLRADGFTDDTIERMIGIRERLEQGDYSEETLESKRMLFAQWLYQHGKISESEE